MTSASPRNAYAIERSAKMTSLLPPSQWSLPRGTRWQRLSRSHGRQDAPLRSSPSTLVERRVCLMQRWSAGLIGVELFFRQLPQAGTSSAS